MCVYTSHAGMSAWGVMSHASATCVIGGWAAETDGARPATLAGVAITDADLPQNHHPPRPGRIGVSDVFTDLQPFPQFGHRPFLGEKLRKLGVGG